MRLDNEMSVLLIFLAHVSGWWLDGLFIFGVALAMGAQVIAYCSGQKTLARLTGMLCGIGSVFLLFVAGQIAGARLWDYANFIAARSLGP
jgi:uncharacterized membrane protein